MEDSESRAALWQRKRPATPATMLTHIKALTLESQHDYCQLLPDDPPQLTRQVWRWISIHQLLTRRAAKPGQLCTPPRPATPAAPPAVLAPVAADPTSVPTVPGAESTVRKPVLSDLASQTLARYRARYGL
jgi:hypothetical protein